jgi:hypothetical protein
MPAEMRVSAAAEEPRWAVDSLKEKDETREGERWLLDTVHGIIGGVHLAWASAPRRCPVYAERVCTEMIPGLVDASVVWALTSLPSFVSNLHTWLAKAPRHVPLALLEKMVRLVRKLTRVALSLRPAKQKKALSV